MSDRVLKALNDPLNVADQLFFARAYREHYPALLSFVRRRVGSDSEAADIAQETYLRVLRYRDAHDVAALKSMLFQIALNLMSDRARRARTENRLEQVPIEDDLLVFANEPSQYREVAGRQDLDRALTIVEDLPPKCREVFVLRRFKGLSLQQTADYLGITRKAVERHMTRALRAFRGKVGRDAE